MPILINDQEYVFSPAQLPMIILGAEKTGTSFFSITLLASLLNSGQKVLFCSAYPMAKEEFRKQALDLSGALILESGEESDLINGINNLADLKERIVFIKNIENYSLKLWECLVNLNKLIIVGDLDKCSFGSQIIKKDFVSKILFSPAKLYPDYEVLGLDKYCGRIFSPELNGVVKIGENINT